MTARSPDREFNGFHRALQVARAERIIETLSEKPFVLLSRSATAADQGGRAATQDSSGAPAPHAGRAPT